MFPLNADFRDWRRTLVESEIMLSKHGEWWLKSLPLLERNMSQKAPPVSRRREETTLCKTLSTKADCYGFPMHCCWPQVLRVENTVE